MLFENQNFAGTPRYSPTCSRLTIYSSREPLEMSSQDGDSEGVEKENESYAPVSFSRNTFRPSFLGSSIHGRSGMIAEVMGRGGMMPPRFGSVIGANENDDQKSDEESIHEELEEKKVAKKSKAKKGPKKNVVSEISTKSISKTPEVTSRELPAEKIKSPDVKSDASDLSEEIGNKNNNYIYLFLHK